MTKEEAASRVKEILAEHYNTLKEKKAAENKAQNILRGLDDNRQPAKRVAGQTVVNIMKGLIHSKGDPRRAAEYADATLHDEFASKALGTSTGDAGGFLVPEEYSQELIELLRPRSVIRTLGPVVVPMTTGNLAMPRLSGGATATYQSESTATKASQEKLEQLRLVWKKLTAIVPISNELLRMSSPAADSIVRDDLILSMATAEDKAFIRADGTANQVRGLRYWAPSANVLTTAYTGIESTQDAKVADVDTDVKALMGALENNDVRMLRPCWIMSPRSRLFLANLRTSNGALAYPEMARAATAFNAGDLSGIATSQNSPGANVASWKGYPVGITNNIPNNLSSNQSEIYLVDMADVVIGEATQFILEVSNEAAYSDSNGTLQSAFARDETIVKAVARHDFVMRHDFSVAVLTGVIYS